MTPLLLCLQISFALSDKGLKDKTYSNNDLYLSYSQNAALVCLVNSPAEHIKGVFLLQHDCTAGC